MANGTLNSGFDSRLQYLRTVKQQRTAEQQRLAQAPHFGAPPSGFMGEGDYIKSLNEDSELAGMEAEAANRPAPRTIVNYGAPGLRAARPGVGTASMGEEEDPMDKGLRQGMATQEYLTRQKGIDDAADVDYDQAVAGMMPRGKRALDLGYTADAARKTGDINRSESMANAREAASEFQDPRVAAARQQKNDEDERLLGIRYGHQAEADAKVRAAQIAADGKTGSAQITGDAKRNSTAITALVRNRGDRSAMGGTISPEDQAALDQQLQQQAGMGQEQPAAVDDVSFNALLAGAGVNKAGKDALAQYWGQLTPDQQRRATMVLGGAR